ncbi:hypothetical protein CATYP_04700 [Corynebacterium atypicum]|uniref:Secreted protein n=1 Tax=Corynebacterium atypicum TaxID=191610 RepID=A0ABN4DCU7_9CORY|nr:hypothetical protein [Corynebacterium atypicum]AIG64052.1 hypothetical protein CATYP_04700 [Corynebacterium atypicum]
MKLFSRKGLAATTAVALTTTTLVAPANAAEAPASELTILAADSQGKEGGETSTTGSSSSDFFKDKDGNTDPEKVVKFVGTIAGVITTIIGVLTAAYNFFNKVAK